MWDGEWEADGRCRTGMAVVGALGGRLAKAKSKADIMDDGEERLGLMEAHEAAHAGCVVPGNRRGGRI